MKIYEVFDKMQDIDDNISEDNVYDTVPINVDNIKKKVFSSDALNKKKKPFGKTFKLTVIAATLAAALIVGTTTINANGGIQIVFEEFFGGNMNAAGLYDGGNVTVTSSDPNLNVELLGVTGDERNVYAVIKATKKDNSAFTDEGYINPVMYTDSTAYSEMIDSLNNNSSDISPDELISKLTSFDGIQVVCKDRNGNNFGFQNSGNTQIIPTYYLSDDRKTLKIMVHLDIASASGLKHLDARDGTMTLTSTSFTARKNIRTIAVYDNAGEATWKDFQNKCKELNINERDCTTLYTPTEVIHCIADKKEYPLPFEMTFTMNYRNNGNIKKSLSVSDAPHFIQSGTYNVQMTISAFEIFIEGESKEVYHDNCFYQPDPNNSKIILKDNTEYYLEIRGGAGGGGSSTGKIHDSFHFHYQPIPNATYELEKTLIDTREIKQIIINGDTVYTSK